MKSDMDPLQCVREGNVDYLKEVALDVVSSFRDMEGGGDSLLSVAVMNTQLDCAKLIYQRCPSLLYCESAGDRYNALHHATSRNNHDMLRFLIDADAQCRSQEGGAQRRLTRMVDNYGNTALMVAIRFGKPLKTVKLLHSADPDFVHPPNNEDQTPLKASLSKPETFKMLLELGPNQSKTPMGPKGWTLLHDAACDGDLDVIKDILRYCPDCSKVVDNTGQNFLHIAAQYEQAEVLRFCIAEKQEVALSVLNERDSKGNTPCYWAVKRSNMEMLEILASASPEYLKAVDNDALCNSVDEDGESLLSKVVKASHLDLSKLICSKCPSLVCHQSGDGRTPLHHAARSGDPMLTKLLIGADTELITTLLMMVDEVGDTALHNAISNRKHEVAKLLLEADPRVVYKANNSGDTPLSIAIQEARKLENRHNTGAIRRLLLEMQPAQCKERGGENDWTPLHFAASHDDVSAVLDIIELCPDCLELVDNHGMNFLHVAAKFKSIQVVQRVLGGKKTPSSVLNMQDSNGNTPLHVAALSGGERLTLCFLYDSDVEKMSVNKDGQHVLHAINFDYDKRKAGVRGVTDLLDQRDLKDQSDFDLVVGALIATLSFTAGITVPGGYISDGPKQGTAALSRKIAFQVFIISNTFALLFSLYAVFSHYCTRRLIKAQDIIYQLNVATYCTLGAIYAMMAAFIAGSFTVLADSTILAISVCAICSSFFVFSTRPMWKIVMQERDGSRRAATPYSGRRSGSP